MYIYVDNFSIINIDVEDTITIFNTVEITDLIDLLHSNKQSNVEGEAGDAVLGRLQPPHPVPARDLRDGDHRHAAGVRAGAAGTPLPQRPGRRRPADRREDRRG